MDQDTKDSQEQCNPLYLIRFLSVLFLHSSKTSTARDQVWDISRNTGWGWVCFSFKCFSFNAMYKPLHLACAFIVDTCWSDPDSWATDSTNTVLIRPMSALTGLGLYDNQCIIFLLLISCGYPVWVISLNLSLGSFYTSILHKPVPLRRLIPHSPKSAPL